MGDDCGTGVAFTRDPATGANGLFGEFLTNAQGEDVVAGVRTPMHISEMEQKFPEAFVQFTMLYSKLHILHVSVVFFKCFANLFELYECFREFLFHFGDVHRCTNTGNNVFTLSIW